MIFLDANLSTETDTDRLVSSALPTPNLTLIGGDFVLIYHLEIIVKFSLKKCFDFLSINIIFA